MDRDHESETDKGQPSAETMARREAVRKTISVRTRAALKARRARGGRLGRPPRCDSYVREQVVGMRCRGASLRAIAAQMTAQGELTPAGLRKPWHHSHVDRLLRTEPARLLIEQYKHTGMDDHLDDGDWTQ
jgi:hypothetical protein